MASPSCLRDLLGRSQTAQCELCLRFPLCEGLVSDDVTPEWGVGQGDGGRGAQGDSDCSAFGVRRRIDLGLCHSQRQDFGLVVAEAGTVTTSQGSFCWKLAQGK